MDRPRSQHKPRPVARKRSATPDHEAQASSGVDVEPTSPQPRPSHQPKPSDASSIASTLSVPSPNPDMPSRTRSASHANLVGQGKRLSLQFPIQPAAGSSSPGLSPRSRPQSWVTSPSPITSPDLAPSPTEGNILAVLAAQERYVLELKEELVKAEQDLKGLKKHWQTHEAVKQRNEFRKVTQLQPLNTALANYKDDPEDEDGSTLWMQKEMERRKALLSGTKSSQRKVFSGSRHLRTLSLLSPDKANYSPSFPQPPDVRDSIDEEISRPQTMARTSTSPALMTRIADNNKDERYDLSGLSNIQRDALLRTGKQMATDFKDGLLTFIEDIRQATVGDEAVHGENVPGSTGAKSNSNKSTRKSSDNRHGQNTTTSSKKLTTQKTPDIGDDFWKEHGLHEPETVSPNQSTHAQKNSRTPQKGASKEDDFDEWDNWDTPNDKYAAKATASHNNSSDESDEPSSPVSGPNSSRTSTSSAAPDYDALGDSKQNSIPWPDLVKLSPSNLKRTASHLMKEWEKNLTPPPEARSGSHSSGDYIGRSASPARLP